MRLSPDKHASACHAQAGDFATTAAITRLVELSSRYSWHVIRTISRVDGGEFFERNGILFLSLDEVQRSTADLISAQPFLGTLAADPTLRGVFRTFSQSLEGVRLGKAKLESLTPALDALANALERLDQGKSPAF